MAMLCMFQSALFAHSFVWHVLIQWQGMDEANVTGEVVDTFRQDHPAFQLEDELFPEGGRDVMVGQVYARRNKRHRG